MSDLCHRCDGKDRSQPVASSDAAGDLAEAVRAPERALTLGWLLARQCAHLGLETAPSRGTATETNAAAYPSSGTTARLGSPLACGHALLEGQKYVSRQVAPAVRLAHARSIDEREDGESAVARPGVVG